MAKTCREVVDLLLCVERTRDAEEPIETSRRPAAIDREKVRRRGEQLLISADGLTQQHLPGCPVGVFTAEPAGWKAKRLYGLYFMTSQQPIDGTECP